MNATNRAALTTFDAALKLYESGDYDGVLGALAADSSTDPRNLVLLANANLKCGHKEAAGDLFHRLAGLVADKRAFFLKSAASLYLNAGASAKLASMGAAAIRANPTDSRFAYDLLKAMHRQSPVEEIEPLLDFLSRSDPEQIYFVACFHRDQTRDFGRCYAALVQGIETCPNDGFLRLQRYSIARLVADFPLLREFDALMKPPRNTYGTQMFSNQTALDRLYWSDDEATQAAPEHGSRRLEGVAFAGGGLTRPHRQISSGPGPLKIGYISNDFGNEVVMAVLRPVLELHDTAAIDFRLFCYSRPDVRKFQEKWPQALRDRIVPIAHLSDEDAAKAISTAGIDILVDLKGHTKGERLGIMRLTDTPVTATYLGYPGSVPGAAIDYLIADLTVTPDASRRHYREKLCRLPEVQMPNEPLGDAIEPAKKSDWGVPEGPFVFASFNGQQKITPRTIDLWSRILSGVSNSILWLSCNDRLGRANILAEFARHGIDGSRIIFNEKVLRFADHIARIGLADLILDTLPYNGHSTTADMLRGGAPVLTVRGNSYHSRVSWSLLKSCDIAELAVAGDDDYVSAAIALADDPERLGEIRQRLWRNRETSPLFDPARMARHLERAYEMMAARARAGLAPDHFDVPALPV
jgi:predicted O-linked N-acetylglucosamine transferase (SPINDLY family)